MINKLPPRRSDCCISYALDYLGDKWTLLVLRDLLFHGKRHFSDFQSSAENIATNILTNRLRQLEAAGMLLRTTDPDNRRSVIYQPTEKAIDLIPTLLELTRWSSKHDTHALIDSELMQRLETDREELIGEIVNRLQEPQGS